jgi:hypothetical protein
MSSLYSKISADAGRLNLTATQALDLAVPSGNIHKQKYLPVKSNFLADKVFIKNKLVYIGFEKSRFSICRKIVKISIKSDRLLWLKSFVIYESLCRNFEIRN